MPAVFDTGPLIYLDALGYLPLLEELYLVTIPGAVAEELVHRSGAPGSVAPALEFVEQVDPGPEAMHGVAANRRPSTQENTRYSRWRSNAGRWRWWMTAPADRSRERWE